MSTQGRKHRGSRWPLLAGAAVLTAASVGALLRSRARTRMLDPSAMPRVGTVDERFQSYNIEMLEVTGGRFWKPYADVVAERSGGPTGDVSAGAAGDVSADRSGGPTPAGMDPSLYEYRPPIDLSNPRLRAMARALGPAYVRVSGTWANTSWFADSEVPPSKPPPGYEAVLTRDQWRGVIEFSRTVDAPIVTSMPTSIGTRDSEGLWQVGQARRWLEFTQASGETVAAAEFMNEPTMASMGGAPEGYDPAAYRRDHRIFTDFIRAEFPDTKIIAPGSVGEADAPWAIASEGYRTQTLLPSAELAAGTGDADAFSYHHYGAVSRRCAAQGHQTAPEQALTEDWLGRTDRTLSFYRRVRDREMPGKPFWNTETAETACGGNPWAKTFLDTFRYLDQLGRLARQGVEVVIHNTLAASDYALLDEKTFAPRPSYWGALLWRKLMGAVVLDAGFSNRAGLHVYAHCLRGASGGVAILAINTSHRRTERLQLSLPAERYTLTAASLMDEQVLLNGDRLQLGPNNTLPMIEGLPAPPGTPSLPPASITFLAVPGANNPGCRC